MSINYITMIEEPAMSNKRTSMFDRLTVPTSNVLVLDWLVESTQETSVFDCLGPMKRKYKRQGYCT